MKKMSISDPVLQVMCLAIILLVGCAIYWPGLDGPLLLDDLPQLASLLDEESLQPAELRGSIMSNSGPLGRPVSMMSFVGNHLLSGDNLYYWKLTNLMLHLVCGIAIFLFLKSIETAIYVRWGRKHNYLALIGTAVWLVHPLQVSTVLYLVQRMTQLATLFMALGLWFYAKARVQQWRGQKATFLLWSSILLFTPLAMLSKENGALLPLLVLVVEFFIFGFQQRPEIKRQFNWFLGLCIALPLIVGITLLIVDLNGLVLDAYAGRPFTLVERLLTESRVITLYLSQIIWPDMSSMTFFYDNYSISQSLTDPLETIASILVLGILLASAWLLKNRQPLFAFGVFFYFGSMSMESTIFSLELVFEHRNYLGLIGIAIAAYSLINQATKSIVIKATVGLLGITLLCTTTVARAKIWSSETSFYNYVYKHNPGSPRINSILAEELTRQKKYNMAIRLLESIDNNGARLQKIYIRCKRGDDLSELDYLKLANSIRPPVNNYAVTGLIEIANLGLDKYCPISIGGYQIFLKRILELQFSDENDKHKVVLYRAHYLWEQGNKSEAIRLLEKISALLPENPIPLYLASEWSAELDDNEAAREYYNRANKVADETSKDYSIYKDDVMRRIKNNP